MKTANLVLKAVNPPTRPGVTVKKVAKNDDGKRVYDKSYF